MGPGEDGSKSSLGEPLPKRAAASAEASANRPPAAGGPETGITGDQPPLPPVENHTVIARVRQDEQQGLVARYTAAAVKFIEAHQDKPFFLYLAHNAVHFPIYPGKKWVVYQSPHGNYSDWVEEVDWSVGQVLETVRSLHLESRTLVLFTSDNGGTPRAVNAPLRGFKGSTWEGGMREPTIAWWPGKIPAGTATDAITGMFDVLPTLVKLAVSSHRVLTDHKLDGGDILAGAGRRIRREKLPHEVFYFYNGLKSSKPCVPARGNCASPPPPNHRRKSPRRTPAPRPPLPLLPWSNSRPISIPTSANRRISPPSIPTKWRTCTRSSTR